MNLRRALAGFLILALILGLLYWRSNARWRPADITFARIDPDQGTRISLDISACNADLAADVRENDEAVAVLISKRNEWDMDCGGRIEIKTDDPIGDRTLLDLSDWEPITRLP